MIYAVIILQVITIVILFVTYTLNRKTIKIYKEMNKR